MPQDEPDKLPVPAPRVPHAGLEAGIEPNELLKRQTLRGATKVVCLDYAPDRVQVTEVADLPAFLAVHRPEWAKVRWISVRGLQDMEALRGISEKYGLHPLAIEDVLTP